MEQFNKVLAAFLLLIVAVGLSLFVFSRLGILSKIIPTTKLENTTAKEEIPNLPTPTPTQTKEKTGILGWFSALGKPQATPTSTKPALTATQGPTKTTSEEVVIAKAPETRETTETNITIVPYGSTSAATYPASGPETLFAALFPTSLAVGIYLKHKSKGDNPKQ